MELPGLIPTEFEEPTLKADPFAQLKLLDVQDLDAKLDLLRHQLATMPETAALEKLAKSRVEIGDLARDAQIRVDDLTRSQKKADADVEQVKTRRARDQDKMDRGSVTSPKDLERMQHEMVSLERRISELEDNELEVMEELETAQHELEALTMRLAEVDSSVAEATKRRDEKAGSVNEQLVQVAEKRTQEASGLPEDLLSLYTRLREQKAGIGAAALRSRRCGGCRLELNAADLAGIAKAPSDEVLRCEECSRILVRTSESGI